MYRPLVVGSLALNFAAGGLEPQGYLLVNLLIHSLAAAAACLLLRALGLSAATALVGGLIFGLHPVQTEPINYISARSESLAALFYLTALTLYLRSSGPLGIPAICSCMWARWPLFCWPCSARRWPSRCP